MVAVQDGRVLGLGASRKLGLYVILRDVYGDVFTYAGLGSIAPTYANPKPTGASRAAVEAASSNAPAPKDAASAGTQPPLTLKVKSPQAPSPSAPSSGKVTIAPVPPAGVPAGMGRVRLYARPGNPDARAAAAAKAAERAREARAANHQPLKKGSVVAAGTVLGTVSVSSRRRRRAPALRGPAGRRLGQHRPRAGALQLGAAAGRASPGGRQVAEPPARRDRERRAADDARAAAARRARRP